MSATFHPLDYFSFKNDVLMSEGVSLQALAEEHGTPLYVYSERGIQERYQAFKDTLQSISSLICYSVKANSNLSLLKLLKDWGSGFDIVSGGELLRLEQLKVPGEKIVFSGVGKTTSEMKQALLYDQNGILAFNMESLEEADTLHSVARSLQKEARICLRFNPSVNAKTHPYISTGLKTSKFGLEEKDILALLKKLPSLPHLRLQGLHVHIGSQITSLKPLEEAFTKTIGFLKKQKLKLPLLNLGGGLGVTYQKEKPPSIEQYGKLILKSIQGLDPKPRVLIEPGRSMVANAGVLLTQILYRKHKGKKDFLIVDASMSELLRPALYGSFHEIVPVLKSSKGPFKTTDVAGPVCESTDVLARDRKLSQSLKAGDTLAILSCGAYGMSMASHYNSRPLPAEVLIHSSGKVARIRNPESLNQTLTRTEKDLVSL